MTLQLKEGGFYRTRSGIKVGPAHCRSEVEDAHAHRKGYPWALNTGFMYFPDGKCAYADKANELDLVSEWVDEPALPVRTVTRLEIVPGTYGRVKIQMKKFTLGGLRPCVELTDPHTFITREQLREAARVLNSLAEALEEQSP